MLPANPIRRACLPPDLALATVSGVRRIVPVPENGHRHGHKPYHFEISGRSVYKAGFNGGYVHGQYVGSAP
jgi:hypothetical protein